MLKTLPETLANELAAWKRAGLKPVIWWRDDDAIEPGQALDRLLELAQRFDFPICIAVIPGLAKPELAPILSAAKLVSVATHGYTHTDHSTKDQKKTELTENLPSRRVQDVLSELEISRSRMGDLFGGTAASLLVPPWNRVSAAVAAELSQSGFKAVSGFAEKRFDPAFVQIDCHLDLMQWRPVKQGKSIPLVLEDLETQLRLARQSGRNHVGLLSHHLVHDEQAWESCAALMQLVAENEVFETASIEELAKL